MCTTSRPILQVTQEVSIPTFFRSQSIKLSRRISSSTFKPTSNSPRNRQYSSIPHFSSSFKPPKLKRPYTTTIPILSNATKTDRTAKMASTTDLDNLPKARQPIVISGPSGSGKSTMLKMLFEKYPGRFGFSVSHTTRNPRGAEEDGVDYFFTTVPKFEEMIKDGGFIEHAKFGSNYYGTSFKAVESIEEKGQVCVLDIEMEGVKQVHNSHLKARYLFLQPPTYEILEQRLRGRATDKEEDIQKRLKQAKVELEYAQTPGAHDKIVINDDKDKAFEEVEKFCLAKE